MKKKPLLFTVTLFAMALSWIPASAQEGPSEPPDPQPMCLFDNCSDFLEAHLAACELSFEFCVDLGNSPVSCRRHADQCSAEAASATIECRRLGHPDVGGTLPNSCRCDDSE